MNLTSVYTLVLNQTKNLLIPFLPNEDQSHVITRLTTSHKDIDIRNGHTYNMHITVHSQANKAIQIDYW